MDTSQQLRTAYEAAKAGNRPRARQIVKEILKVEPNNDTAWYLYAELQKPDRFPSIALRKYWKSIPPMHSLARIWKDSKMKFLYP